MERHYRLSGGEAYAVSHESGPSQSNTWVTLRDRSPRSVPEPPKGPALNSCGPFWCSGCCRQAGRAQEVVRRSRARARDRRAPDRVPLFASRSDRCHVGRRVGPGGEDLLAYGDELLGVASEGGLDRVEGGAGGAPQEELLPSEAVVRLGAVYVGEHGSSMGNVTESVGPISENAGRGRMPDMFLIRKGDAA